MHVRKIQTYFLYFEDLQSLKNFDDYDYLH